MNNIGTIISILVGLATLLSMFVWFGRFIQRVNVHDKKLDDLSKDVDDLKLDVNSVKTLLMSNFKEFGVALAGKHSPRALNEMGRKIFEDMHGKEFLEKNKDLLFAYVDKDKPKTAYDVEGLCYLACLMNVNNDAFIEIKSFLYNYPTITLPDGKEHEVTMDEACSVLSLPLRDMYLEEHPDIVR
jgi:hypothetical protein